jgi:orotidine-5'-phosphate decarboxylase
VAACFKVQIAYYEAYGMQGMEAYRKTLAYLRSQKTITIADVKRGDIAKTAEMYASHLQIQNKAKRFHFQ